MGSAAACDGAEPTCTFETDPVTTEWSSALGASMLARVVRVSFDGSHGPGENVDVAMIALVGFLTDGNKPDASICGGAIPAELGVTGLKRLKKRKNWLPIESNPKVVCKYLRKLGFGNASNPQAVSVHELMSLDDWALDMVPRPARAVLLLFPISDETEQARKAGLEQAGDATLPENVVHMKQLVGNACGTIALVHCMANLCRHGGESADAGSWLEKFLVAYKEGMTSDDVGQLLEEDAAIEAAHKEAEAESEARNDHHANRNLHFIAFVEIAGLVVEFDGRNAGPIVRGRTADYGDFLAAAVAVIRRCYMEVSPDALRFNMMALCGGAGAVALPDISGVAAPKVTDEAVQQLVALGLDEDLARDALGATNGNVEAAANMLLGG